MMPRVLLVVVIGMVALGAATRVAAHHSFAAEFDVNAPIELTGTVTSIEWGNPHAWFYLDVRNAQGQYENWGFELGSPNGLMRRGWTRSALKLGDTVTAAGWRAKDGSFKANARSVVLSTGRQLFAGSSQSEAEGDKN